MLEKQKGSFYFPVVRVKRVFEKSRQHDESTRRPVLDTDITPVASSRPSGIPAILNSILPVYGNWWKNTRSASLYSRHRVRHRLVNRNDSVPPQKRGFFLALQRRIGCVLFPDSAKTTNQPNRRWKKKRKKEEWNRTPTSRRRKVENKRKTRAELGEEIVRAKGREYFEGLFAREGREIFFCCILSVFSSTPPSNR